MDPLHLSQHISRQFNSEIEDVRRQVLAMGGLVEEQIAASLRMLVERDATGGTEIREREQQVNAAELAIDERCAYILARRQPAASDLRLVLAVVKMLADVERIGDEAKRIAKLAERLVGEEGGTPGDRGEDDEGDPDQHRVDSEIPPDAAAHAGHDAVVEWAEEAAVRCVSHAPMLAFRGTRRPR